jgi:glycosyltransferase involved in cell wall biosynthesis
MTNPAPPPAAAKPLQVAAFFIHPTQHHAPWFRALAAREEIYFKVYYFSRHGVTASHDQDFGQVFQWDVPLLDGYDHEFLPTLPGLDPNYSGMLRMNLGIGAALNSRPWDAVLNPSYTFLINWAIWLQALRRGIPQIYHSDSTLVQPRALWRRLFKELPVRVYFQGLAMFLSSGDNNRAYLHRYGVSDQVITPCPIPVDISRFQKCRAAPDWEARLQTLRDQYRLRPDDRIAVFCGKIEDRKRPQDLAAAVLRLDSPRVKALFIGSGPLAPTLQQTHPEKVIVTGFVNQSQIPYHLGLGHLLVMPSSFDPHPIAVTEAASLGLPAVISDKCGCAGPHDILRPGENGLVYPVGEVDALARNLKLLLLDDLPLYQRMAARALELAATQDVSVAAEAVIRSLQSFRRRHPQSRRRPDPVALR